MFFQNTLITLELCENNIGEGIRYLNLPKTLECLYLKKTNIGTWLKDLILPEGLKELSFGDKSITDTDLINLTVPEGLEYLNIDDSNVTVYGLNAIIPKNLQGLYIYFINIDDLSELRLPSRLIQLYLIGNNIKHFENFMLPPKLKYLNIENIKTIYHVDDLKKIRFPYEIDCIKTRDWKDGDVLLNYSKTSEAKAKYESVKWFYEKTIQKEICRGLMLDNLKDPIYVFLQKNKHFRENILMYINVIF